jgi:hypothetical protein
MNLFYMSLSLLMYYVDQLGSETKACPQSCQSQRAIRHFSRTGRLGISSRVRLARYVTVQQRFTITNAHACREWKRRYFCCARMQNASASREEFRLHSEFIIAGDSHQCDT